MDIQIKILKGDKTKIRTQQYIQLKQKKFNFVKIPAQSVVFKIIDNIILTANERGLFIHKYLKYCSVPGLGLSMLD